MLDLALHATKSPVSLADISDRQSISVSYLEQLFAKLRKRGLVLSVRGPGGGYQLAAPPKTVFVAQIIDAVDELVDATRCGGQGDCQQGATCLTHELWSDLSTQIHTFLANISLQELLDRREVQAVAIRQSEAQRQRLTLPESERLASVF
jgi:Rrf2 family iron-sulfur cluster assembly transcriptional regulator